MQQPDPETRFLAAIGRAARALLGADHPLVGAMGAAAVQEQLAALDEGRRVQILAAAHREMREDLAAIWGFLPGASAAGVVH
ncbi:hypothetical protein [Gemmobacter serpentinus]|uniref:hypothetical protein n=1 Tax=Gemmobacter serpentinus TaxID=2652247 RepID=UPI00124D59D9|nr:hypothetical protein [Gemmobacter serpentinus]